MNSRCGWCGVVREAFFHCYVWQGLKIPDFVEVPAVAGASVVFYGGVICCFIVPCVVRFVM